MYYRVRIAEGQQQCMDCDLGKDGRHYCTMNCSGAKLDFTTRHGTCDDVERALRELAAEGKITVHDADECVTRIYRAAHGG